MAGTRGAFGSIARGRDALQRRGRALVLFGLALVGCAASQTPPAAAPAPVAPPPARAALPPQAATTRTVLGPERYQGLAGAELVRLLGRPDMLRRDGGAEIWQYRAGACILHLFLYEEGGALLVVHAEARNRTSGRACLAPRIEERAADAQL
jgi:hypothetical protein